MIETIPEFSSNNMIDIGASGFRRFQDAKLPFG